MRNNDHQPLGRGVTHHTATVSNIFIFKVVTDAIDNSGGLRTLFSYCVVISTGGLTATYCSGVVIDAASRTS